jgi:hypothetical protein
MPIVFTCEDLVFIEVLVAIEIPCMSWIPGNLQLVATWDRGSAHLEFPGVYS